MLRQAVAATDLNDGVTLREFWRAYNIYKTVLNINAALNELLPMAMNSLWKKLCL